MARSNTMPLKLRSKSAAGFMAVEEPVLLTIRSSISSPFLVGRQHQVGLLMGLRLPSRL